MVKHFGAGCLGIAFEIAALQSLPSAATEDRNPSRCSIQSGMLDGTACLTAAIAHACKITSDDAALRLPSGTYSVSTLMVPCSGITIAGIGPGDGEGNGTTIKLLPSDGDGIRFAPSEGDGRLKGAHLSGVRIDGRDRTGGSAIAFDMVEHGSVDNVVLRDVHDGIRFGSGIHYKASNIFMDQVRHNGFIVRGNIPAGRRSGREAASLILRSRMLASATWISTMRAWRSPVVRLPFGCGVRSGAARRSRRSGATRSEALAARRRVRWAVWSPKPARRASS